MEKDDNIVLSKNISEAIDRNKLNKKIEDINIIQTLCASDAEIKVALKAMKVGFLKILKCKNRDDLQKLYIVHIGLDRVIDANKVAEKKQKFKNDEKLNLNYHNALQSLRDKRAESIIELFESTNNKKSREQIFAGLSANEKEEVARVLKLREGIKKMDEMFERSI